MRRVVFRLEFDGSSFCGWQLQAGDQGVEPSPESEALNLPSIQGVIEKAISVVLRRRDQRFSVRGCGRTDAGVHAEEYFAHVELPVADLPDETALERFRHKMNGVLPAHIGITDARFAVDDFHVLDDIVTKTYEYRLLLRRSKPVLLNGHCHWIALESFDEKSFNRAAIRAAMRDLEGEHDFKAFAAANASAKTSVRKLVKCELVSEAMGETPDTGELLSFRFEGDGFLKQMVRNLVGTLIEIGQGRRSAACIRELLGTDTGKVGRRLDAGFCAPPTGLFLVKVNYDRR